MAQTLFDKYGGLPAVTVIVRDFYKRMMRHPALRHYFGNIPMERLIHHQISFVSMAMGKMPHDYQGRSMKIAHQGMGITAEVFDLTGQMMREALTAAQVDPDDITAILQAIEALRSEIVER